MENNSKFQLSAEWLFQEVHGDAVCIPSTGRSPRLKHNLVWTLLLSQQNRAEFFLNTSCWTPLIFFYFSFPPTETLTKADRCRRYPSLLNILLPPVFASSFFCFFFQFYIEKMWAVGIIGTCQHRLSYSGLLTCTGMQLGENGGEKILRRTMYLRKISHLKKILLENEKNQWQSILTWHGAWNELFPRKFTPLLPYFNSMLRHPQLCT